MTPNSVRMAIRCPAMNMSPPDWLPLTGVQPGEKVIIRRIHETAEDNHELMEFLETNGIVPGRMRRSMRRIILQSDAVPANG